VAYFLCPRSGGGTNPEHLRRKKNFMIRKISMLLIVAALAATVGFAAAPSMAKKSAHHMMVKGTVDKIDTAAKTITVTVGTESKTYTYNQKSWIMQGKKKMKIDDLKSGDTVTVTADTKNYIRKIDIAPAMAAAPTKP